MKMIKNIILWCGYGKTNENVEYGRKEVGGGGGRKKRQLNRPLAIRGHATNASFKQ